MQKMVIGMGLAISATIGAATVKPRAIKLQIPKEVPTNSVGKRPAYAIYTVVKFTDIPNLAIIMNIGINGSILVPRRIIKIPPTSAITNPKAKAFFARRKLYTRPPVRQATISPVDSA